MRIAYVTDHCQSCFIGGAAFNDNGMTQKGIERGHQIKIITPDNLKYRSIGNVDLIIFSNITAFPRDYIVDLSKRYKYIFHHKDFNFYNFRLFYPMVKGDYKGIDRDYWLDLYLRAKSHIWLSPLHRDAFLVAFPELEKFKKIFIPSCLDTDIWKPQDSTKRIPGTVLGINCMEDFKGKQNVERYVNQHPELKFTFVGLGTPFIAPNCTSYPYVRNEDLPILYSRFEYFLHLPGNTEPFGRTGAEAKLCGCKIITNENNGAFSYDFMRLPDINIIRNTLRMASLAFWEEIESSMGILNLKTLDRKRLLEDR